MCSYVYSLHTPTTIFRRVRDQMFHHSNFVQKSVDRLALAVFHEVDEPLSPWLLPNVSTLHIAEPLVVAASADVITGRSLVDDLSTDHR